MANIRLKASASSGIALSVSANTATATYPSSGITIVAEAQDSEIDLSADPVVTDVVYRASFEALQHEIRALYKFLPLTVFPPQTVGISDSIGPFVVGFNPSDTPTITDAPVMTFTRAPFTDSVSVSQNIILHSTKSVVDSVSASDPIEILIGGDDGGLCNGGNMVVGSTPPFGGEFALGFFGFTSNAGSPGGPP